MDVINELFVAAREELEYAKEEAETVSATGLLLLLLLLPPLQSLNMPRKGQRRWVLLSLLLLGRIAHKHRHLHW